MSDPNAMQPARLPAPRTRNRPLESVSPWVWVATAALIAALLTPRQVAFPFKYEVGEPWSYPTLKAPFDFEVLYPESEVRSEVDRVLAEHGPYFLLDPEVGRQQKQQLAYLLREQLQNSRHDAQYVDLQRNASTYQFFGQQLLDRLYQRGILETEEARQLSPDTTAYVIAGREERVQPLRALMTVEKARLYLADTLPYSPLRQPELILPLLERTISANLHYSEPATAAAKRRKLAAVMSTGISVQKGEVIVARGAAVTEESARKLASLARRSETPKGPTVMLGYFLLALLAFGSFMVWLQLSPRVGASVTWAFQLPAGLILLALLLINAGLRLGAPVPLLLPLWALPLVLRRWYGRTYTLAGGGLFLFLTMLAVDWSAGWLALQVTGSLGALALYPLARDWPRRITMAAAVGGLQIIVWLACILAERIPDALKTFDVALFLAAGAALSLGVFPLDRWIGERGER